MVCFAGSSGCFNRGGSALLQPNIHLYLCKNMSTCRVLHHEKHIYTFCSLPAVLPPPPSPRHRVELTWRREGRFHQEVYMTPTPPAAGTPPPHPQGTGGPVCSECECLWETRGPRRSWSRGPTRPSRSPGIPWRGRRTGRSAAGPMMCTG